MECKTTRSSSGGGLTSFDAFRGTERISVRGEADNWLVFISIRFDPILKKQIETYVIFSGLDTDESASCLSVLR